MQYGYANAALWSIGNGLTTGPLITYLAQDLGAQSLGVSLLLAIPALVGLLRLFAPPIISRLGGAKRTTLAMYLASYTLLLGLPALALEPGLSPFPSALAALVLLICVHQLLEYIGTVALWAWLGELVPPAIRGRYFSRRQFFQSAVLIPTLWLSGGYADHWRATHAATDLGGYARCCGAGALVLVASLVPLGMMPASLPARRGKRPKPATGLSSLAVPLADRRFRWLLAFGCWFSFFNGIAQSPQSIYPKDALHLGLFSQALMRTLMHVGQGAASLMIGRWIDRYGNRPVLAASQLIVATGPLFFLLATPEQPGWLYGAWVVWSAYVGMNVGLPNLTLKLGGANSPGYLATYFAASSLCYAASTVAGGLLFKQFGSLSRPVVGEWSLYQVIFLLTWLARSAGVFWILQIDEPGARPRLPWSLARWRGPAARREVLTPLETVAATERTRQ